MPSLNAFEVRPSVPPGVTPFLPRVGQGVRTLVERRSVEVSPQVWNTPP